VLVVSIDYGGQVLAEEKKILSFVSNFDKVPTFLYKG
jgi:hypothetical protein